MAGEADNNTSSAPAGLWLKLLLSLAKIVDKIVKTTHGKYFIFLFSFNDLHSTVLSFSKVHF